MALRLSKGVMGASRLRPTTALLSHHVPAIATQTGARFETNYPPAEPFPAPEKKAKSILDSLPGNSLVSKTAILSATAGLSIAAISSEIFVINEEAVVAFCLLTMYTALAKYGGPGYKEWAEAQSTKMKEILYAARADHTNAVKDRIANVEQMKDVVDITKNLFEVSKETAKLESQVFELEQRTAFAAEAKAVLESWVRYEGQVKQRQQKELTETVIGNVQKELQNPKFLQQVLNQSIADVEKVLAAKK